MYKLRIYKLSGSDKGNLDHEEIFDTKEQIDKRYDELFNMKNNEHDFHSFERWQVLGRKVGIK